MTAGICDDVCRLDWLERLRRKYMWRFADALFKGFVL